MAEDGGSQPPAGLSFGGFKGRVKPKLNVSEAEAARRREAITGFGARGGIAADGQPAAAGPRVIPRQQDSFVVGVGRTRDAGQAAGDAAAGAAPAANGSAEAAAGSQNGGSRAAGSSQPGSRQRIPSFIPERDDGSVGNVEDRFAAAEEQKVDTSVSYGLTVHARRQQPDADAAAAAETNGAVHPPQQNGHAAAAAAPGGVTSRDWESRVFKEDVARLPDEADEAAYEAMPIEEFGAAMLRGMGWSEGQGVGRRKVGPAQPFQYVQRPHRLGLGAEPAKPEESKKRHIKPGESREAKQHKVFIDEEGRQRHVMSLDDKLVDRRLLGVHPGKTMHLLKGRHEGLTCEVIALEPKVPDRSDRAVVRLAPSGESVSVRCSELGEKHEADARQRDRDAEKHERKREKQERKREREQAQDARQAAASGAEAKRRRPDGGAERDAGLQDRNGGDEARQQNGRRGSGTVRDTDAVAPSVDSRPRNWLLPHIRVRVIDKRLLQGQLYLKKATVLDVLAPMHGEIVVDDTGRHVNVMQQELETYVPKAPGTRVAFVRGEHRGRRGKLLDKNAKVQAAAVELLVDDVTLVVKVACDDICQYVGDDED